MIYTEGMQLQLAMISDGDGCNLHIKESVTVHSKVTKVTGAAPAQERKVFLSIKS